jgi:hypothetical protein
MDRGQAHAKAGQRLALDQLPEVGLGGFGDIDHCSLGNSRPTSVRGMLVRSDSEMWITGLF